MRVISGIIAVIMLLFASVQYNDPDGLYWGLAYGIPGVWALTNAINPSALNGPVATPILVVLSAAAFYGVYYFWPQMNGWWREEVWWQEETVREGMGVMIIAGVFVFFVAMRMIRAR